MNEAWLLPGLLLAVLAWPVLSAFIVWIFGGADARRTHLSAANLAAVHLILTGVFVGLCLDGRKTDAPNSFQTFQPMAVPGDPGLANNSPLGITTWTVMPITGANAKSLVGTAVQFFVGVDGLNLWLIALTSLMTFLSILVSRESVKDRAAAFYIWIFLLQAACLGAFLSLDLILFYIFFELTLVPAFFLIGSWGVGGARRDAARKFFLYTLLGSLLTLVGMLGLAINNPTPMFKSVRDKESVLERLHPGEAKTVMPIAGAVTFSIPQLMENVQVWDEAYAAQAKYAPESEGAAKRKSLNYWLFLALIAGFVVKIPLVPFHTWLPGAYGEAPLSVTMLLSAVMAKLGTFGLLRIVIPLAPEQVAEHGLSIFGTLAGISIVYAALCAYAQRDLKLLAAYSSVSHLGLLALGLFALSPESLTGATIQMVNHGLTAGAMFALLAYLHDRYRTTDVTQYSGLWSRSPRFAFFFILIALASVGLPGLNGFPGEMLILAGLFDPRNLGIAGFGLALCAAAGVFLGAWYTFTAVKRVFFGPLKEPAGDAKPITGTEAVTFSTLAALCLALGLCPQPMIDSIKPDISRVSHAVEAARQRLHPEQKPHSEPTTPHKH